MGVGGEKRPMREIGDTRASAAEDRFEIIIQKVKAAGAEIVKDEESPLYAEIGDQQLEIGTERIVQFNLNRMDFQITRDVKTGRITGAGHHKAVEELPYPSVDIKLKRKPELSDSWIAVDIDEMF